MYFKIWIRTFLYIHARVCVGARVILCVYMCRHNAWRNFDLERQPNTCCTNWHPFILHFPSNSHNRMIDWWPINTLDQELITNRGTKSKARSKQQSKQKQEIWTPKNRVQTWKFWRTRRALKAPLISETWNQKYKAYYKLQIDAKLAP